MGCSCLDGSSEVFLLCVSLGTFVLVQPYHFATFISRTVTTAMRDMGKASASPLSGTIQHPRQRTAAWGKATLTALGK